MSRKSTPERLDNKTTDGLTDLRLPIITGPTPAPERRGITAFARLMVDLYPGFPNREALLEKRLGEGPVPVRFRVD